MMVETWRELASSHEPPKVIARAKGPVVIVSTGFAGLTAQGLQSFGPRLTDIPRECVVIDPQLEGRVALITGANHGIGAATPRIIAWPVAYFAVMS